jgi:hypothetical protein
VDAHPLHRGGLVESEVASQNHHFRMLCIDRQDPEFHVQKVMPNDLFARILYELTSAPNLSQSEPCPSKPSQPSFYQSLPSKPCSQNLQSLALPCPSKPCPFKASFYQSLAFDFNQMSMSSSKRNLQDKVGTGQGRQASPAANSEEPLRRTVSVLDALEGDAGSIVSMLAAGRFAIRAVAWAGLHDSKNRTRQLV